MTSSLASLSQSAGSSIRTRNPHGILSRVYTCSNPRMFDLEKFGSQKNLEAVFDHLRVHSGEAPGENDVTFKELTSTQKHQLLSALSRSLIQKEYQPRPIRKVEIPKGNGKVRELSIQCIEDRIVAKALQLATDRLWRRRLPRIGISPAQLFADLERNIRKYKKYWLAVDDIRDCFPSIPISAALAIQMDVFGGTAAEHLVRQVTLGHEGQGLTGGVGQGSPYSPVLVECVLHYRFDKPMKGNRNRIPLFRYVDNLTFSVGGISSARMVIEEASCTLKQIDHTLTLKGESQPINLRDPKHGQTILGFKPLWSNGRFTLKIHEQAFLQLEESIEDSVVKGMDLYPLLKGWVSAYGPALNKSERNAVLERVIGQTRPYFNRRFPSDQLLADMKTAHSRWLRLRGNP